MIAIVVPTLNRSHLLGPLAQNIEETTDHAHSLVFVVDPDDTKSQTVVAELDALVVRAAGTYPQKINAGVAVSHEPYLALVNDDVLFHPGWYEAAMGGFCEDMQVVGPNDLSPATGNGDHATFPIVRRSYIEDPGAVWGEPGIALCELYHHNFSETELWALAADRGLARFVPECVIEHVHPDWGKAEHDETYERGAKTNFEEDQALFEQRKAEWQSQL